MYQPQCTFVGPKPRLLEYHDTTSPLSPMCDVTACCVHIFSFHFCARREGWVYQRSVFWRTTIILQQDFILFWIGFMSATFILSCKLVWQFSRWVLGRFLGRIVRPHMCVLLQCQIVHLTEVIWGNKSAVFLPSIGHFNWLNLVKTFDQPWENNALLEGGPSSILLVVLGQTLTLSPPYHEVSWCTWLTARW